MGPGDVSFRCGYSGCHGLGLTVLLIASVFCRFDTLVPLGLMGTLARIAFLAIRMTADQHSCLAPWDALVRVMPSRLHASSTVTNWR